MSEPSDTWLSLATRPHVIRSAVIVALVVGTILNAINQGGVILSGRTPVWWKLILTYLVPYCVSTYGAVTALRKRGK